MMNNLLVIRPSELLNKKTLIIGDVSSGKTLLTAYIIGEWVKSRSGLDITIIDLAPRYGSVGRGIDEYIDVGHLRYYSDAGFKAPRLMSRNKLELNKYIYDNYVKAMKLFKRFEEVPTGILVVNDLGIFLHYGDTDYLDSLFELPSTLLVNAYYGSRISRSFSHELDELERIRIERLFKIMDVLIKI